MATGRYQKWLENDNLALLRGWKMNGLTDEQIAANIGVSPRTLERWKKSHSQICRALKKGKEEANYAVENALLKKALKGDNTAMIFWLKNNYPDKYSENVTDPELLKQQIRRVKAEADIADAKAKDINSDSNGQVIVNVTMPDPPPSTGGDDDAGD
ncbi:helix-turn-helix domain-containing protein [Lactiplantibacillus paraxiangfangensis]|uniref:helix-turn-helix domain-containing protein n=1 Tax=Lactiplantibacillus paraxiangfangensis TaxID=3076224 RepID=UPI0030C680B3